MGIRILLFIWLVGCLVYLPFQSDVSLFAKPLAYALRDVSDIFPRSFLSPRYEDFLDNFQNRFKIHIVVNITILRISTWWLDHLLSDTRVPDAKFSPSLLQ